MADGRLGQAETVASCGEAAKIPDREKDAEQIEVKMAITLAHAKNYNYEFDLVQAGRHRDAMEADAASDWLFGSERSKRPGCADAVERAKIVPAAVIKEMSNE